MQDLNSPTFPNGNSEREICNQGQSCIKISKMSVGISYNAYISMLVESMKSKIWAKYSEIIVVKKLRLPIRLDFILDTSGKNYASLGRVFFPAIIVISADCLQILS